MDVKNLKKYLQSVLEMELNAYTQQQVISETIKLINSLGKQRKHISAPTKNTSTAGPLGFIIGSGIVSWIIAGLINGISEFNKVNGGIFAKFFAFFGCIIVGAVNGFLVGLIAAVPVGLLVWLIYKPIAKKMHENDYNQEFADYERRSRAQEKENDKLNNKISALYKVLRYLENGLACTKENLKKAYGFGILARDYRNIYAISAILGYLENGKTQSLTFNERTGDRGAYNIYDEERRLDRIITNTEEILYRLDDLVRQQNRLAEGLAKANSQINVMVKDVNKFMNITSNALDNIQASQGVIAYNTRKTATEMEFLSWMRVLGY